jgi:beta-aspartyl-peptidase (threonine type)
MMDRPSQKRGRPALLVHGGAWATPGREIEAHRIGVHRASLIGFEILLTGGSAVDAVQKVVEFLEGDPTFNAGRGSVLNARGEVELDAAVMEGTELKAGAVACVSRILHPVTLAREVLESSKHVLLSGEGAHEFARSRGVPLCEPQELVVDRERERYRRAKAGGLPGSSSESLPPDTVGAVACDSRGRVAAACSTGGTFLKLPGRIGDSPIPGAGLYADDRRGAAASTGQGESILRMVMAYRAVEAMTSGIGPSEAAQQAIRALESRCGGQGGIILVDSKGELGYAFNTKHMAHAYLAEGMTKPEVGI